MDDQGRRPAATKRIKAKRRFRNNLVSYVVINAFLVFEPLVMPVPEHGMCCLIRSARV